MKSLATVVALAAVATAQNSTVCTSGLYMIVARGSLEPPGLGYMGEVSGNVSLKIPDSTTEAVMYPATEIGYTSSEAVGVANMTLLLDEYLAKCPSGKVALMGYSQGAQVAADTVCGTSEESFTTTAALSNLYINNVIAIVMFGDPSHVPGEPWDVGTSNRSGIFPRQNNSACGPYASVMKSWCDNGDIYCDSGSNLSTHGSYFAKYTNAAVDFVVGQFNSSMSSSGSSSSNGSSSTTTSATTSPTSSSSSSSPSVSTSPKSGAAGLSVGGVTAQIVVGLVVFWGLIS